MPEILHRPAANDRSVFFGGWLTAHRAVPSLISVTSLLLVAYSVKASWMRTVPLTDYGVPLSRALLGMAISLVAIPVHDTVSSAQLPEGRPLSHLRLAWALFWVALISAGLASLGDATAFDFGIVLIAIAAVILASVVATPVTASAIGGLGGLGLIAMFRYDSSNLFDAGILVTAFTFMLYSLHRYAKNGSSAKGYG